MLWQNAEAGNAEVSTAMAQKKKIENPGPPETEGPRAPTTAQPESDEPANDFPIVGIGASAGGLAAFERFFTALPARHRHGLRCGPTPQPAP
jgi:two-component system, chemotaxis family, CheB/CheR fusion protein